VPVGKTTTLPVALHALMIRTALALLLLAAPAGAQTGVSRFQATRATAVSGHARNGLRCRKISGARMIAAASSGDKMQACKTGGADEPIN